VLAAPHLDEAAGPARGIAILELDAQAGFIGVDVHEWFHGA
jgi:hypothetical protein